MGKKKGVIWDSFNIKGKSVVCKYCGVYYKQGNSCKMEKHIKKCFKCPAGLRCVLRAGATSVNKTSTNLKDISKPKPLTEDVTVDQGGLLGQSTETLMHLTKAGPSSAQSSSSNIHMGPPKPWPNPSSVFLMILPSSVFLMILGIVSLIQYYR